jgi:hypothetical protein
MFRGGRSVKTESQGLNAVLVQLGDGFIGQLRGGAGRDGNVQAKAARVIDQLIDVPTP